MELKELTIKGINPQYGKEGKYVIETSEGIAVFLSDKQMNNAINASSGIRELARMEVTDHISKFPFIGLVDGKICTELHATTIGEPVIDETTNKQSIINKVITTVDKKGLSTQEIVEIPHVYGMYSEKNFPMGKPELIGTMNPNAKDGFIARGFASFKPNMSQFAAVVVMNAQLKKLGL